MPQHIHTHSLNDGVETRTKTVTKTAEGQLRMDAVIPAAAANFPVAVAFPLTGMQSLKIEASAAMDLETNDAATPDQTITLGADDPLEWKDDDPYDNPITAAVTGLFVTSTAGGILRIRVLWDPTP